MTAVDPLRMVEMLAVLEEASIPLCHDIRNRIASIRNLSYFVRRKLASEETPQRDPRVNEFLAKIEGEVQRTDDLIDAWGVSVHGMRSSEVRTVRAADCIRLAIETARSSERVGFEFVSPAEPLEIQGDLEMLAFALRCLLENAGEASGSGCVSIKAEREDDRCSVTVTDRGPGISDPVRCLERFESTKQGHLGLGLCMARRIVSRFGGDLMIGSPEVGAQVSLLIPIAGTRSAPMAEH
ncbi:MAG TPA: HAMP domain-containing sensor histidine kinase [Polyangiaceae bacterium]|nr:HAMP domain-containing sensor histidine kinase [Polyangiaceae bacterium]